MSALASHRTKKTRASLERSVGLHRLVGGDRTQKRLGRLSIEVTSKKNPGGQTTRRRTPQNEGQPYDLTEPARKLGEIGRLSFGS